jgi:hypothetical protein
MGVSYREAVRPHRQSTEAWESFRAQEIDKLRRTYAATGRFSCHPRHRPRHTEAEREACWEMSATLLAAYVKNRRGW